MNQLQEWLSEQWDIKTNITHFNHILMVWILPFVPFEAWELLDGIINHRGIHNKDYKRK